MLDILTIGHSTLDTFVQIPKAHLHCKLDTKTCELCLGYGDKIVVDEIVPSLGGNAANSAAGLAKLGFKTGILTYLGKDGEGGKIVKLLNGYMVREDWIAQSVGGKTDQSVILTYQGERTILAYHYPWVYQFPQDFPQTKWIYLTSINENFKSFHQELLTWHRTLQGNIPCLAYNPGSHELKVGLRANLDILKRCEVLILNKEEAASWISTVQRSNLVTRLDLVKDLLQKLYKAGPKIIVITDAQNGSFAYDGQNFYEQEIYPAQRVEMTGAGDVFSAGFLGALLAGQNIPTALKWGNALASSVIQKVGATQGLLTKEKLIEIINKQ